MKAELVYWDSCAFLGWLQAEPDKVDMCGGTLDRAKAGEIGIVTSALTITEVLWTKNSPRITADRADTLNRFFRHSWIRIHNVTRTTATSAQDVVWNHGVKPKDAIHVATALELGIPTLETFDDGVLKLNGLIGTPPLIVRKPIAADQGSFQFGQ